MENTPPQPLCLGIATDLESFCRFDAASLAILDRLSRIEALLDSPASNHQTNHPSPHASSTASGSTVLPSRETTLRAHSPISGRPLENQREVSEIFPICIATAAASRVETVLQWPTFGGQIATDEILAPVFANKGYESDEDDVEDGEAHGWGNNGRQDQNSMDHHESHQHHQIRDDYSRTRKGVGIFDEKLLGQPSGEIAILVQRFFRNVHTKNPILDSSVLDRYVYDVEQHGFGWTGRSCLLVRHYSARAVSVSDKNPSCWYVLWAPYRRHTTHTRQPLTCQSNQRCIRPLRSVRDTSRPRKNDWDL